MKRFSPWMAYLPILQWTPGQRILTALFFQRWIYAFLILYSFWALKSWPGFVFGFQMSDNSSRTDFVPENHMGRLRYAAKVKQSDRLGEDGPCVGCGRLKVCGGCVRIEALEDDDRGGNQMWMLLPQVNFDVIPIYKNGGKRIFEFGDRLNPPHWPPKFENPHYGAKK